jgi:anti-anti-sigma factor
MRRIAPGVASILVPILPVHRTSRTKALHPNKAAQDAIAAHPAPRAGVVTGLLGVDPARGLYSPFAASKEGPMQIAESRAGAALVLTLDGRLDSSTAPDFGKRLAALVERGEGRIIIDFAKLEYVSSAGLAVLLSATKSIRARQGDILLAQVNDRILRVFQMSGFVSLYKMFPSVQDAVA